MKQKDIYLVSLDPTLGHEQKGLRPAVIISGNTMNDNLGVVMICPLTSKIKYYENCQIINKNLSNGLVSDSEVRTFQLRSVSSLRLKKKLGEIEDDQLKRILIDLQEIMIY